MRFIAAFFALIAPASALAQAAAPAGAPSPLSSMLPMVLIFVVFYFLLIRPQQRKFKEHAALLAALKKGDEVITAGGIVGKVIEADKDGISTVEIASGVQVRVTKQSIVSLTAKPQAVVTGKKGKGDAHIKNDNVALKKEQIANDN